MWQGILSERLSHWRIMFPCKMYRMTQHYARVLDKNIMEDMQGVAKLIFK